jgi:hypothetical protein
MFSRYATENGSRLFVVRTKTMEWGIRLTRALEEELVYGVPKGTIVNKQWRRRDTEERGSDLICWSRTAASTAVVIACCLRTECLEMGWQ